MTLQSAVLLRLLQLASPSLPVASSFGATERIAEVAEPTSYLWLLAASDASSAPLVVWSTSLSTNDRAAIESARRVSDGRWEALELAPENSGGQPAVLASAGTGRALAVWLQEPGEGPILECEQFLKIHFADSGTTANILRNIEATRAWVLEQNDENLATARAYLDHRGAFPERAALNQLVGTFLTNFYVTVAEWVDWASTVAGGWPDDPAGAPFDVEVAEEGVRRAERVIALLDPAGRRPGRSTGTP